MADATQITPPTPTKEYRRSKRLLGRPTRTHSGVQRFPSTDPLFKAPAKRTKPSPLLGRSRGSVIDVRTAVTGQLVNNDPGPPPPPLLLGGGRKGSTPLLGRPRRQLPAPISVSTDNLATPFKKSRTSPLLGRPTRTHSGVPRFPSTDLLFKAPAKRTKPSPLLGRSRGSLIDVRMPVTGQAANNNPVPPTPPPLPPRNGTMKRPSH